LNFYEKNRFTPRRDFVTPATRHVREYVLFFEKERTIVET